MIFTEDFRGLGPSLIEDDPQTGNPVLICQLSLAYKTEPHRWTREEWFTDFKPVYETRLYGNRHRPQRETVDSGKFTRVKAMRSVTRESYEIRINEGDFPESAKNHPKFDRWFKSRLNIRGVVTLGKFVREI